MPSTSSPSLASTKKKQKPFSKQHGGQWHANMKLFKQTLAHLSGNEPISLISAFLKTREGKQLLPHLNISSGLLDDVIQRIFRQHQKAPKCHRKMWLSLLAPSFTRKELTERMFCFGTNQFTKAVQLNSLSETEESEYLIQIVSKKRKRGPGIQPETQKLIQEFGYAHSKASPNKSVFVGEKSEKERIPVRFMEDSVSSLYLKFMEENSTVKVRFSLS